MKKTDETTEVVLQRHAETDLAFFFSDTGEEDDAKWIAKSQCGDIIDKGRGAFEVTIPEWLAKKNGWI